MNGNPKDVSIDSDITYSLKTNSFNKSLKLVNHSPHTYVFKIKTNQKTVVSLQTTHDFIHPETTKVITIKLADKPSQGGALKLEFNYAVAHAQDIANNDSKMNSYPKENVFKKIITVERKDDTNQEQKLGYKPQDAEVYLQKSFASPMKMQNSNSETRELKYPQVDLTKSEVTKFVNLQKSTQIDIANIIKKEKSLQLQISNEGSHSTGKDTKRESPKKTESFPNLIKQPSNYSQLNEERLTSNLLDTSTNIFFSMPASNRDISFESVFEMSSEGTSNKKEKQSTISELSGKIENERRVIRSLQGCQSQNSAYPLSLIVALIVASFFLGSSLKWALFQL